jgi:pimeloyl-ACP methyl ester carboxylesterase
MSDTKTIRLGPGRTLHAAAAGRGPDLVLIHGAITTHRDWLIGPFPFERLTRDFRVTAIDRPGHGQSLRPRFDSAPRAQAAQIHDGLAELGIDRAIFVGHSFGAMAALALAEQYPESVAGLVLVAPLAFPEIRPLEHLLLAPRALPVAGPFVSRIAEQTLDRPMLLLVHRMMFAPQPVPADWEAGYPWDEILARDAMVAQGEDAAAILPLSASATINYRSIRSPALILQGTADRVVNRAVHAIPLAAMLPNAQLNELEGIGHMAHHAAPNAVETAIADQRALA